MVEIRGLTRVAPEKRDTSGAETVLHSFTGAPDGGSTRALFA